MDLDDEELKLTIKSLSITYDAMSKKLERMHGRYYDESLAEISICDRALAKARAEQSKRWHQQAS